MRINNFNWNEVNTIFGWDFWFGAASNSGYTVICSGHNRTAYYYLSFRYHHHAIQCILWAYHVKVPIWDLNTPYLLHVICTPIMLLESAAKKFAIKYIRYKDITYFLSSKEATMIRGCILGFFHYGFKF